MDRIAADTVGILRQSAGRDPYDKRLTDLIGELSTRSEAFRVRWAAHDLNLHRTGVKRFRHPVAGELTLAFEAPGLLGDTGQTLTVYTPEPGSPSQSAMRLLASWAATEATAVSGSDATTPEGSTADAVAASERLTRPRHT